MSTATVVIVLAVSGAFAFALSTVLKHASASSGPALASYRPSALGRFVLATVRHPLWLCSILADLAGLSLQVLALHFGALAVVQPLLVTGLLFTVLLNGLRSRSLPVGQIGWASLLALSLGGFLLVAHITTSDLPNQRVDRLPAVLVCLVGAGVAGSAIVLARRMRPAVTRAALLGLAVGLVYAADAALLKALTDQASSHGILSLLISWQLYAVVAAGLGGLFLCQLAYQAGPLTASQPTITAVDPLASVVIGVLVYDEQLRRGPFTGAELTILVALLAVAIIGLARQQAFQPEPQDVLAAAGQPTH